MLFCITIDSGSKYGKVVFWAGYLNTDVNELSNTCSYDLKLDIFSMLHIQRIIVK